MTRKQRSEAECLYYLVRILADLQHQQLAPGLVEALTPHELTCALVAGAGPCSCNAKIPELPGRN